MPEKFWTEDFTVLFTNVCIFPTEKMTRDEKLNALTRLAVVGAVTLFVLKYEYWHAVLIGSIAVILAIKYSQKKEHENFTLVPTYANPDMHTTTVAPTFAEEWQIYPPIYDIFVNTPEEQTFEEPLLPQSYPYGQYLTRTNLLPSDERATHMLNGTKAAREYVNGSFIRHALSNRENMTRLYKKRLARRFRHNGTQDSFSPFSSY